MKKAKHAGNEIYAKYQLLGPDLKAIVVEGEVQWSDPKGEEKGDAEFDELLKKTKVDLQIGRLDWNTLTGLSGQELVALEPICENIPDQP